MKRVWGAPAAVADIKGSCDHPCLCGKVYFYKMRCGVLIEAEICGLPSNGSGFFGFHIHEGKSCTGEGFADSGSHYNPSNTSHPLHAGDLPPLMACGRSAYIAVRTDRFDISQMIGRTVIIHDMPDDLKTQPSGNAGTKIACGVIKRM